MNPTPHEYFAREPEPGTRRSHGTRARRGKELPSLPEECRPEPEARSILHPLEPAEAPRCTPSDWQEPPRAEAPEPRRTTRPPKSSFESLLRSLVGRTVTVIDPESFEEAAVGHKVRTAIYRAELAGLGEDYVILVGEFVHRSAGSANSGTKESIRHYVPLANIKRISILAKEPMIHL